MKFTKLDKEMKRAKASGERAQASAKQWMAEHPKTVVAIGCAADVGVIAVGATAMTKAVGLTLVTVGAVVYCIGVFSLTARVIDACMEANADAKRGRTIDGSAQRVA